MVAIVDDDDLMRSALQGLLKSAGLTAQAFASAEAFLTSGQQNQVGCLVADIRMPGMSGLELQAKLNADHCRIPTIFITAHGDEKMRMQALSPARECSSSSGELSPIGSVHAVQGVLCGNYRNVADQ